MQEAAEVLFFGHREADHEVLAGVFAGCHWKLYHARSAVEAWSAIHSRRLDVIIADAGPGWRDLLAEVQDMDSPPPFVVASAARNDSLWAEVLERGGFDVLLKPFDATEIFRTLSFAWREYRGRLHLSSMRALAATA